MSVEGTGSLLWAGRIRVGQATATRLGWAGRSSDLRGVLLSTTAVGLILQLGRVLVRGCLVVGRALQRRVECFTF
jgi:hypothetical protein